MTEFRMLRVRKIVVATLFSCLACSGDQQVVQHEAAVQSSERRATVTLPVVLFLGTSITAGLGVSQNEAYPALIQDKLDSAGIALRIVNAGESGGTSAGGLRRIDLLLENHDVRVLVLELGANDGLRGLDVGEMGSNLSMIVERARAVNPTVELVVAGMEAPPNLGERYTSSFRSVFAELSNRYAGSLIPFLLEGVGAVPELNQEDGIHPNVEGHRVIAETVWDVLAPVVTRISEN